MYNINSMPKKKVDFNFDEILDDSKKYPDSYMGPSARQASDYALRKMEKIEGKYDKDSDKMMRQLKRASLKKKKRKSKKRKYSKKRKDTKKRKYSKKRKSSKQRKYTKKRKYKKKRMKGGALNKALLDATEVKATEVGPPGVPPPEDTLGEAQEMTVDPPEPDPELLITHSPGVIGELVEWTGATFGNPSLWNAEWGGKGFWRGQVGEIIVKDDDGARVLFVNESPAGGRYAHDFSPEHAALLRPLSKLSPKGRLKRENYAYTKHNIWSAEQEKALAETDAELTMAWEAMQDVEGSEGLTPSQIRKVTPSAAIIESYHRAGTPGSRQLDRLEREQA